MGEGRGENGGKRGEGKERRGKREEERLREKRSQEKGGRKNGIIGKVFWTPESCRTQPTTCSRSHAESLME